MERKSRGYKKREDSEEDNIRGKQRDKRLRA
jgi:hypothetical protein